VVEDQFKETTVLSIAHRLNFIRLVVAHELANLHSLLVALSDSPSLTPTHSMLTISCVHTCSNSDKILVLNTGGTVDSFDTPEGHLAKGSYYATQLAEENKSL
jgi:ABC-type multidrug transport system fused ATPase/permease subunit